MAGPCFPSQVKEFPFKQDEIADIWRLAKENYIDRGAPFEEAIAGMARDLGMRKEHIAQAFTKPKVIRHISNDVWTKLNRRREAIQQARGMVEGLNDSKLSQKIKQAYDVPRSALTFGHGGVFPMTHMGSFVFKPLRWKTFFQTSANAWGFFGKAGTKRYEVAVLRHLADPYYDIARRASKSVDLAQPTVGILTNMKGWTGRGFNSLKIARLDLFKKEFSKLPIEEQTLENAKPIMNVIDHATGEVNLGQAGKYMAKGLFAPKLLPARFMGAVVDPIRAVETFANWKNATAGERQAARFVASGIAQNLAFYGGVLALNEGINQFVGSKDHVNFTKPGGDFLSFKVAGLSIRPPNDLIETLRLAGGIVRPFTQTHKELRGESPEARASHNVADYLRYKIHPTLRLGIEVAAGTDLFGRPLPYSGIRQHLTGEPAKASESKPPITMGEYALGKGPIPLGGAAREFYDMLREEGMDHKDAMVWIRAAAVGGIEATGVAAHEAYQPKKKPTSLRQEMFKRALGPSLDH